MKILIVDDQERASERIRGILSASSDMSFLEVSDPQFALKLLEFGIEIDVALIDLRFGNNLNVADDYDGLSICQKIRNTSQDAVIVGYSSGFSIDNKETRQLKKRFLSMGANIVCALDHLTLTPASELRNEWESAYSTISNGPSQPRIFVGSSTKGLEQANRIQSALEHDFAVDVWNQTVFGLGETTIEALEQAVRDYQFGIFVCTPDDQIISESETRFVPRDNVIFEAGLFIGSLGRRRTFIVKQRELNLMSDFDGLTVATYDHQNLNVAAALGPACQKIRDAVNRMSKKS